MKNGLAIKIARHLWSMNIHSSNDLAEEVRNKILVSYLGEEVDFKYVDEILDKNWDVWEKQMIEDLKNVGKMKTYCTDTDEEVLYSPTCPYGRKDCNLDPAYIQATYPKWYERLSEYIHCKDCNHGENYNNL